MKKLLFLSILMLLPMLASAQTVSDVQNSGCLYKTRGDESQSVPTIVLTKEGNILSVQLLNYDSNCGTADFNVSSDISSGNDGETCTLSVSVVPVVPEGEEMDCYCPYNVSFTVRDLEPNSFYFNCWWYEGLVELTEGEPLVLEDVYEDVTIDGETFTLRKAFHHAMLKKSGWVGELRIPSELKYEGQTYSVTSISNYAFMDNTTLTKVYIPRTITNMDFNKESGIHRNPFIECSALESIEVEEGNPVLCTVDGVLFNKEKTRLYTYPAADSRSSYTVPEGVTIIEASAFANNHHLVSILLPDEVTSLGSSTFHDCTNLEEVNLPSGLKRLEGYLFLNCQHLKSVTIPDGVTYLGINLFNGCTSLTSVAMPESVTTADYSIFENCTSLKSVTLSPNLEQINHKMFLNCNSLTDIQIPKSVTGVMSNAFQNCKALKSVDLPENVSRLGDSVFSGCKLKSLYIRGIIDFSWTTHYQLFDGMGTETKVYVRQSQVDQFKAIYKGTIYPLPEIQENSDYLPFVEVGKEWHMVVSRIGQYRFMEYTLSNETLIEDATGKTYFRMYSKDGDAVHDMGFFREEDRKVYYLEPNSTKEILLFDYSLKVGDTYETYTYDEYDEKKKVTYKVLSVNDYTEGPKARLEVYDKESGNMITQSRYLRMWTVCSTDNGIYKTWIEGVGSLGGPLENLYNDSPISTCSNLAYVSVNVESEGFIVQFLPFSFYDMYNQVHGSGLSAAADQSSTDWDEQFTFELEGNLLHVYGKTYLNCGCKHYAYFFEEQTEDPFVRKLHFQIQREGVEATCYSFAILDFYVPGFYPEINYTVVDEYGEEYPVFNKMAYRPMIEEGKVWKVGSTTGISDDIVKMVDYYYFDGDTIINGKICKQMMRQRYVNPEYPDYAIVMKYPLLQYMGAWYEEDKKVYFYNANSKQMRLMYDFSVDDNATLQIHGQSYVIGSKQSGGIKGFKGVYRDVMMLWDEEQNTYNTTWLEGVGCIDGPTVSVYLGEENHALFLMSCTVGDEVIYLNDEYEDGATPWEMDAKKHRFDFTHTIKTKPRTRSEAVEEPLYGEYNDQQLGINLDPLDEAYMVRITDKSDNVVYEKAINAGNIVGL
ncbi:MAG: leucine-rich repeat domain-containing protein, partial [Prevotella sp.]|nr:leucine-rich repeat domain-containing protein [Prevotella sp.]